jgi:hypothetical protein
MLYFIIRGNKLKLILILISVLMHCYTSLLVEVKRDKNNEVLTSSILK